jgi:hypothetical protein
MKRICMSLLLAVVIQSSCIAEVANLPSEDRKLLEDSSTFHEVRTISDLPPAIVALCADSNGKLADPGQKWEVADAITDASLPRKRLIWAAISADQYVVHYERGGRGHSFHILVATLGAGQAKPQVIWRAVGGQLDNYAAFVDALRSGKLDDNLAYGY